MPRKKVTTTTEDVTEPDESPALQDARETVEGIEAELPNETTARIHRTHLSIAGGKEHYCGQVDAKLISPDYLQTQYGGGQYRIQLMGPMPGKGGKTRIGPLKQMRFDVDPSLPPKNPQASLGTPVTGPVSSGNSGHDMNSLMVLQVIESINATRKMETAAMERLLQQPQGPKVDWSPIIAAMITAVPSVLTALGQRKDPVELATKLMESLRPAESVQPTDQLSKLLDVVGKMSERMHRTTGTGDGASPTGWLDVVREYAPVLQQLLNQRGEPSPDMGSPPSPSPEPTALPSAPEPMKALPPTLAYLSPLLPRLLADAQIGRDAETCASYYIAEVPPGHYSTLRSIVASPTLTADLTAAVPEFAPYAVWVEELRSALVELLTDDAGASPTR